MTTKAMKTKVQAAQTTILKATQISKDQHSEIMFRLGISFAEHFCSTFLNKEDMAKKLLQDKSYCYWPWFKMVYLHDDVLMIANDCLDTANTDAEAYTTMKECIIGDELLENDLYHFISDHL